MKCGHRGRARPPRRRRRLRASAAVVVALLQPRRRSRPLVACSSAFAAETPHSGVSSPSLVHKDHALGAQRSGPRAWLKREVTAMQPLPRVGCARLADRPRPRPHPSAHGRNRDHKHRYDDHSRHRFVESPAVWPQRCGVSARACEPTASRAKNNVVLAGRPRRACGDNGGDGAVVYTLARSEPWMAVEAGPRGTSEGRVRSR